MNNNICILTDTHFGFENNSEQVLESSIKFFEEVLVPFLNKNKIDKIFILGDLFESRTTINTRTHNVVYDLFDKTLKDFEIYILIGNHDIYYNSTTDVHSLKFLYKFENVTVIDKPQIVKIINKDILMVPWIVNQKEIPDILNEFPAEIIMGHFDIAGFSFNKHVLSKNGIDPTTFRRAKKIFSGHFHTRSDRAIGESRFVYIGTPYQLTRADMDEERGFIIYNLRTNKHKFFSNEVSTRFVKLEYPNRFTEEMIKNNRVDVVIKYKDDEYAPNEYNKYIEEIEQLCPAKLSPMYINVSDDKTDFDIKACNLSSIPDLMKNYIEAMNLKPLDKEEVYKILVRLYNKTTGEV